MMPRRQILLAALAIAAACGRPGTVPIDPETARLQADAGVETFFDTCMATLPNFAGVARAFAENALVEEPTEPDFWSVPGGGISAGLREDARRRSCGVVIFGASPARLGTQVSRALTARYGADSWTLITRDGVPATRVETPTGEAIVLIARLPDRLSSVVVSTAKE